MKKVFVLLSVLGLLAVTSSAFAQYSTNWVDDFENYTAGQSLSGQGPWATPIKSGKAYTNTFSVSNKQFNSPNASANQGTGGTGTQTGNVADLRFKNTGGLKYYQGFVQFWVYDDNTTGADTRVGLVSSTNGGHSGDQANIVSANVTDTSTTKYWRAQWSYANITLDGSSTVASGTANSTWTQYAAAPRLKGWNMVNILWGFDYSNPTKTGFFEWRINTWDTANVTLSYNSACTRWSGMPDVVGVYMGTSQPCGNTGMYVDDIWFSGDAVPEPSSFLALGTGLVGLAGLIRRKR